MKLSNKDFRILRLLSGVTEAYATDICERLQVSAMNIFVVLAQLEEKGVIAGRTEKSGEPPPRRVYRITETGQDALLAAVQSGAFVPEEPSLLELPENELRAKISALNSPALSKLRANVRVARTSVLISWFMNPAQILDDLCVAEFGKRMVDLDRAQAKRIDAVLAGTALAIGDEIDRRIPVPA